MSKNPFEEFAVMLEDLVKNLDAEMPDIISVAVMVELEAIHKQRIFGEGKNSEGGKIGEYSTGKNAKGEQVGAYYSKEIFIRKAAFKQQGKKKTGKFKNGNERKSMFLPAGYSQFRDIQGRQTEFVDIKFSGSAERGIGIVKLGSATLYGTRDLKESKKLAGNVKRFGDFLSLSLEEKEFIKSEIKEQAIIVMKKHGK